MFSPMFIQSIVNQSRDPVQTEQLYSPGVLIGNWFENCRRYSCDYHINKSIYNTDYRVPFPQHLCDYDMPDRIAQHNGVGGELLLHHGDECYKKNFISSYDLHYRVLASHFRGHRKYSKRLRTLVPEQDFAMCYNTLTQFGNLKKKCECPVKPYITEYNDSYVPQTSGLRKARAAVPRDNSTAMANTMPDRKIVPAKDSEPMMSNYKPPEYFDKKMQ